jgi:stage IV sporulation protein FB
MNPRFRFKLGSIESLFETPLAIETRRRPRLAIESADGIEPGKSISGKVNHEAIADRDDRIKRPRLIDPDPPVRRTVRSRPRTFGMIQFVRRVSVIRGSRTSVMLALYCYVIMFGKSPMLAEPARTPYDVKFRFLGFPVRIHPFFWLTSLLTYRAGGGDLRPAFIWAGVVFVSILIHETGHALAARVCRERPWIVLHGMGGLCVHEGRFLTISERLLISFCGPGAGFILAAIVFLFGYIAIGVRPLDVLALYDIGPGDVDAAFASLRRLNYVGRFVFIQMIWVNLCWGLVNLLPIWPLDGGQMSEALFERSGANAPMRSTHILSIATSALMAIVGFVRKDEFLLIFFLIFAAYNFYVLRATGGYGGYRTERDPADWWKSK